MIRQVYGRMATVIHRDDEHRLNRRAFLHIMFLAFAALGLSAVPPAALARWAERAQPRRALEPPGAPMAEEEDLKPVESVPINRPIERDPAVPVHPPEGGFVAYDRRCTHLLCPLLWEPGLDRLVCPCHDGHFSARTGHVLYGPPRRSLPVETKMDHQPSPNQRG